MMLDPVLVNDRKVQLWFGKPRLHQSEPERSLLRRIRSDSHESKGNPGALNSSLARMPVDCGYEAFRCAVRLGSSFEVGPRYSYQVIGKHHEIVQRQPWVGD